MREITENGKNVLRLLFTDFLVSYNSNNLRKKIPISNAGSLKLLRDMEKRGVLTSKKLGNAIFYRPNLKSSYVLKLLELIFVDHTSLSPFIKGWVTDLHTFSPLAKGIFLFGSILTKERDAKDVDVCFILKRGSDYKKIQQMVLATNQKNTLPIHPLYLTEQEFRKKLETKDKPLIEMVKNCVIVHGEDWFVGMLKHVQE